MKEVSELLQDSISMKSEEHIKNMFSRPMIFTDMFLTFITGAGFITWHHGIMIGLISLVLGILINLLLGITATIIYWILAGTLHPLIYQWGVASYNSNNQKLESILVMMIVFIITIL